VWFACGQSSGQALGGAGAGDEGEREGARERGLHLYDDKKDEVGTTVAFGRQRRRRWVKGKRKAGGKR